MSTQQRFRKAYEVDFTSLANLNIKTGGNGTKVIDGKSWTWANDSSSSTANVVNGTGIVVALNNTASANCLLTIPVTSLFPGYSLIRHILRVSVRVLLTNSITNFEMGGVGITNGGGAGSFACIKGFNGAANCVLYQSQINTVTSAGGQTDDVMGMMFDAPATAEGRSGLYVAGRPLRVQNLRASETQQVAAASVLQTTPKIFIQTSSSNSQALTDGFAATYTHFRLDYYDKIPPTV